MENQQVSVVRQLSKRTGHDPKWNWGCGQVVHHHSAIHFHDHQPLALHISAHWLLGRRSLNMVGDPWDIAAAMNWWANWSWNRAYAFTISNVAPVKFHSQPTSSTTSMMSTLQKHIPIACTAPRATSWWSNSKWPNRNRKCSNRMAYVDRSDPTVHAICPSCSGKKQHRGIAESIN